jgi:hypothetical protein
VPDQHHLASAKPAETADDRLVLGEVAVPGERHEILDQAGDIVLEVRPLRMTRDLRLLPGRQPGIGVAQHAFGLGLQLVDLGIDVDRAGLRSFAQFGNARFQFRERFFEIQERCHFGAGG